MWTHATQAQYAFPDLALPRNLTDPEWALLEPFFPALWRWGDGPHHARRAGADAAGHIKHRRYIERGRGAPTSNGPGEDHRAIIPRGARRSPTRNIGSRQSH